MKNGSGELSERLKVLLAISKGREENWTWQAVAKALEETYASGMNQGHVMHHVTAAYMEALREPRLCMGNMDSKLEEMLLAPVRGFSSIEVMGPSTVKQTYSVEAFYNAMISKVLGDLSVACVGWMGEERPDGWKAEQTAAA